MFAIRSCVTTKVIEVLKKIRMEENNVKKDDENGQLSHRIYSSPFFAKVLVGNRLIIM